MASDGVAGFYPNTILIFEVNQCAPSANELEILERWLAGWRSQPQSKKLVIGGALETPLSGRLRRLRAILNVLEGLGINLRSIQTMEDWFIPTRMGMSEALPADIAWIGLSDAPPTDSTPNRRCVKVSSG